MLNSPHLTDAEVDAMCAGLRQSAAKVRYITQVLGIPCQRRPNGRPLVLRADLERRQAHNAPAPSNGPNWSRAA